MINIIIKEDRGTEIIKIEVRSSGEKRYIGLEDYQHNSQSITPIFVFSLMKLVQKGIKETCANEI